MDNLESMSAGKVITETLTDVVSWICNVDGWHRWSDLGSGLVDQYSPAGLGWPCGPDCHYREVSDSCNSPCYSPHHTGLFSTDLTSIDAGRRVRLNNNKA
jgi:hypothetical protein